MEKCKCGKQSRHTIFEGGRRQRLCCECYIGAGGTAADWHPDCMRAIGRLKEVVIWGKLEERQSSLI